MRIFSILYIFIIFSAFTHTADAKKPEKHEKIQIPFDLLTEERREEVRDIVEKHSIFQEFRKVEYKSRKSVVEFMMDHPVFLSVTLKAMKIRKYIVKQNDDRTYSFDDQKGISARFEFTHKSVGKRFYYGTATYKGILLKVAGRGVGFLEFREEAGNPQKTYVNANIYGKVDNVAIELFFKLVKPFILPIMNRKIRKFINQTKTLAEQIATEPDKVYKAIVESGEADEKELDEFRKLIEEQKSYFTAEVAKSAE